jgi:hypothetical protein
MLWRHPCPGTLLRRLEEIRGDVVHPQRCKTQSERWSDDFKPKVGWNRPTCRLPEPKRNCAVARQGLNLRDPSHRRCGITNEGF